MIRFGWLQGMDENFLALELILLSNHFLGYLLFSKAKIMSQQLDQKLTAKKEISKLYKKIEELAAANDFLKKFNLLRSR